MGEEIVEVFETRERNGLYFTTDRIIVAKLGGDELSILFGNIGDIVEARRRAKRKEQFSKLSAESILAADTENFAIPYSEVTRIEWSKKKANIISGSFTYKFKLKKRKEFEGCVDTLSSILGGKLFVS